MCIIYFHLIKYLFSYQLIKHNWLTFFSGFGIKAFKQLHIVNLYRAFKFQLETWIFVFYI